MATSSKGAFPNSRTFQRGKFDPCDSFAGKIAEIVHKLREPNISARHKFKGTHRALTDALRHWETTFSWAGVPSVAGVTRGFDNDKHCPSISSSRRPIPKLPRSCKNSICWLCGTKIKNHYECEHVLNVQNQISLGQFFDGTRGKGKSRGPTMPPLYEDSDDDWVIWLNTNIVHDVNLIPFYSYAPSHKCCNQIKLESSIIDRDGNFSNRELKKILNSIYEKWDKKDPSSKCNTLNLDESSIPFQGRRSKLSKDDWVKRRIFVITRELDNKMIPLIKAAIRKDPKLGELITASNFIRDNAMPSNPALNRLFKRAKRTERRLVADHLGNVRKMTRKDFNHYQKKNNLHISKWNGAPKVWETDGIVDDQDSEDEEYEKARRRVEGDPYEEVLEERKLMDKEQQVIRSMISQKRLNERSVQARAKRAKKIAEKRHTSKEDEVVSYMADAAEARARAQGIKRPEVEALMELGRGGSRRHSRSTVSGYKNFNKKKNKTQKRR